MRQIFSGLAAVVAVVGLGAAPAMACGGGGGLFAGPCSPCGSAYVSPCNQGYYAGAGYGYDDYSPYQRLSVPSPQYFWVNQGPVYDGPGQFAPRPFYQERIVTGWRGHYGYTGGPYANPINHYPYGGVAWGGPAITTYHWRHYRARPARLRYGYRAPVSYRYGARPSVRYGYSARPNFRYGHARPSVRYGYAPHAMHRQAYRAAAPRVHAPRYRDSGSYSYRSGFHQGARPHRHH